MTVSDRWFLHPDANSRQSRSKCGEAGGAMPGMPGIVVATFWWLACLSSIDEVIGEAQAEATCCLRLQRARAASVGGDGNRLCGADQR